MPGNKPASNGGGVVTREPTVWAYAAVILAALLALAVLRHFFGPIRAGS